MSRPPLLREENTDVLTDDSYVELFRDKILPNLLKKNDNEQLQKVKDIMSVVNLLANHLEYMPYIHSYFVSRLALIESHIYYSCFSIRTTLDDTLDEIIENVFENCKALDRMQDDLPIILSLENYKQNMKILALEFPKLDFEMNCCTTILLHLRWYHQKITLNLFVISIIKDNLDQCASSRHDVIEILRTSKLNFKQNCIAVLNILQDFDYYPTIQNEFLYFSLTTVFSMFLYLSESMKNDENALETGYIIALLRDTHTRMLGSEENYHSIYNLKWQTSLFFYTFFLRTTMEKFNLSSKYAKFYEFDPKYYDDISKKLAKHARESKDDMVELLKTSFINKKKMTTFGSFVTEDQDQMKVSFNLFKEITMHDLNFLKVSSIPKLWGYSTASASKDFSDSNDSNSTSNKNTKNSNDEDDANDNDNKNDDDDDDDDGEKEEEGEEEDDDDDDDDNDNDNDNDVDDYDRSLFPTGFTTSIDETYSEQGTNENNDENAMSNKLFGKIEEYLDHGVFFYDRDFFFRKLGAKM